MNNWMKIGKFQVFPWSVSGIESAIVVKSDEMRVCFDIGYAHREAVNTEYVCVTHGHMDHLAGLVHHTAKRDLFNWSQPTYFIPSHLNEPLSKIGKLFGQMQERNSDMNDLKLCNIKCGEPLQLGPPGWQRTVQAFPTVHPVDSQGYIIYKKKKQLKPQYKELSSQDIARLLKEETQIHDITTTPEVAYTGDTTVNAFINPQNPDILKVDLLITEATYIDYDSNGRRVNLAWERGHMHLNDIITNEHLFKDVGKILLVHFSDRYTAGYISEHIYSSLPSSLKNKVYLGLNDGIQREYEDY